MKEFQAPPGPSASSPFSTCWTGPTGTPRASNSPRAAVTSGTTSCTPCTEPGGTGTTPSPAPSTIEQSEPGGVSCTMRTPPPSRMSWSTAKPTCSL
ncbi:hypothetical protein ADL22_29150 [Streptomyces sp. NRRL F-4489]|nr:hypothetical protein ADL22_29150 [Streptomyces sp. NRRL F-4489]